LVQKQWADTEDFILRVTKKGEKSFEEAVKETEDHYIQRIKKRYGSFVYYFMQKEENDKGFEDSIFLMRETN